jgi:hypothetical protein
LPVDASSKEALDRRSAKGQATAEMNALNAIQAIRI